MASITQGTVVGVVSEIKGEAFATNAQGQMRRLKVGDNILEGDVVITSTGGSVDIAFFDGPGLTVAEQQSVAVDDQVASTASAEDATAGAVAPLGATTAATVIEAVTGQTDLDALLADDPTAAGLTGDGADGGHSFVDLVRIVEAVPTADFNFPTNPAGTAPTIEGQLLVPTTTTVTPLLSVSVDVVVQPPGGVNPPEGGVLPGGAFSFVGTDGVFVQEGTDGENAHNLVTFILRLDQASTQDVTVSYQIQPGTAVPGTDYVGTLSGTVTIPAGTTEIPVTVDITPDSLDEGPNTIAGAEDFFIVLTGSTGATIDPSANTARGFIVDDDFTRISIVSNGDVNEATSPSFTVSVSQPLDQDLTVTLSNEDTVTIKAGETSAIYVAPPQGEDVYTDPGSVTIGLVSVSTAGTVPNEFVLGGPATAAIGDTLDPTTVSLGVSPAAITEAGATVTYTATLTNAAQGAVTVTLSNGDTITIANGQTTGTVEHTYAPSDDVYLDPTSASVTISTATGGNFEQLVVDPAAAVVTIADTLDPTTVSLGVSPAAITEAGATVTYTATLTNAAQGAVTVTLSNGDTITIADGQTTGTVEHVYAASDDVYLDPTSASVTISTATGGNFEQLVVDPAPAVVTIGDTIDPTTVTLSDVTVTEGGNFVYTATVNHAPQGNLVITLNDAAQTTITILSGQTSGTSAAVVAPNAPNGGSQVTVGIASAVGGNFEQLVTSDTALVTIVDHTPSNPVNDAVTVEEESVPGIGGNNEADGYSYTATGTFANNASWGSDGFGSIVSVNGISTVVAGKITVADSVGTLVVDVATGSYTYTLNDNVLQSGAGENLQTAPSFAIVGQDSDGSSIGFNLNVSVVDDVPVVHVNNAFIANQSGIQITGDLAPIGADSGGTAHVAWTTSMATLNSLGLTSAGRAVTFTLSPDSSLITASTTAGTVFTVQANASGTYDLTTFAPLDLSSLSLASASVSSGGGPKPVYYWYTDGTLSNSSQPIAGKDMVVMITATKNGLPDNINPSSNGIGVDNGNLDGGEVMKFAFDAAGTSGKANLAYAVRFELENYKASEDTLTVSGKFFNGATFSGDHFVIETSGGKTYLTVTADPGQYFDSLDLTMVSGQVKVAGLNTFTLDDAQPKVLPLAFTATDGDGDTASGSMSITLQNQPTFTGSSGDDIIAGGTGNDVMTGGLGADTFVWKLADAPAGTTTDKVTDFSSQDSLDLRDLLSHGANLAIDNTAHTVTATYSDVAGVHTQVVEVMINAAEPIKTLVNQDGVVKIG